MVNNPCIARPVGDLGKTKTMYCAGLEISVIGCFENHDGFDGVMFGQSHSNYHVEFTSCRNHFIHPSPRPRRSGCFPHQRTVRVAERWEIDAWHLYGLLVKRFLRRHRSTEKNVNEGGTLFVSDRSGQGERSMENLGPIRSPKANVSSRGWAAPSDAILSVPL